MHTTDNGDGTYTHRMEPGDMTNAIACFRVSGTNSFLIDDASCTGVTQAACDAHMAHEHPVLWWLMRFRQRRNS